MRLELDRLESQDAGEYPNDVAKARRECIQEKSRIFSRSSKLQIDAVAKINKAIEREYAARPLTRAEIQAQLDSILRQELEATDRSGQRRRR